MRQNLDVLANRLLDEGGFEIIQVETAGTFFQSWLDDPEVHVVVSPKTTKIHAEFMREERPRTYFKYVIDGTASGDALPFSSTQPDGKGGRPARPPEGVPVYLSPCDREDDILPDKEREGPGSRAKQQLYVRDLAMKHGYIMSLQTHKILDIP